MKKEVPVSDWFSSPLREETPAEKYRQFNEEYFADLHEQERMLSDKRRMEFYHEAITRHIKSGDHVIDLGTGTGILAAFASRQGAAKVHALDHSTIIDHARELAKENGIENVDFEEIHSTKFHLDKPVDVILHEQVGDFLFDEAMVPNVSDLRDRLLKPGGLILPSEFDLFCEPVTLHSRQREPFIWELTDVHGFDFSSMKKSSPDYPEYYILVSCDPSMVKSLIGEPEPMVAIDLHTITKSTLPSTVTFTRKVKQAGPIDGLVVYMNARVDDDLLLTSNPLDPDRASHWGFRILRMDQTQAEIGDELEVTLTVKDWVDPHTWKWSCEKVTAAS